MSTLWISFYNGIYVEIIIIFKNVLKLSIKEYHKLLWYVQHETPSIWPNTMCVWDIFIFSYSWKDYIFLCNSYELNDTLWSKHLVFWYEPMRSRSFICIKHTQGSYVQDHFYVFKKIAKCIGLCYSARTLLKLR